MRCLFAASLVVATLAGHVYGHRHTAPSPYDDGPVKRRKTLGFGPDHPHAVFHSSPYQVQTNGFAPFDSNMCPIEVAHLFIQDVLQNEGTNYKIRKDSYTDKNTGVTHVYVRQVVNGLEVVDGDMNINVKDGVVLSYGNSVGPHLKPLSHDQYLPLSTSSTAVPLLFHLLILMLPLFVILIERLAMSSRPC